MQYAACLLELMLADRARQKPLRPPFAGVFGSMPYAHPYSHGMPAGSVDLSGGPTSSGPQGYGMRLGPGMPSTITDSADDDPGDGTARAVKRARLVWTPQLHKRFEEAVNKLGPEKSIPKNIMQVRWSGQYAWKIRGTGVLHVHWAAFCSRTHIYTG